MSEYYIGAIRANSNYLAHYRTKGTKNGEGKYFRNGVPTAEGLKRYGRNAGYSVVGPSGDTVSLKGIGGGIRQNISYNQKARPLLGNTTSAKMFRGAKKTVGKSSVNGIYDGLVDQARNVSGGPRHYLVFKKVNPITGQTIPDTKTLRSGVEKIASTAGNWGQQAVKDVGNWLSGAKDTVKSWLSGAGNWLKGAWDKAVSWCKGAGQKMFSFAKKVVGKAAQWGGVAINAVKNTARTVANYVGGFVRGIAHTPDAKKGDFHDGSGYELGYKVRTGAQNVAREAGKAIDSAGKAVGGFVDNITGLSSKKKRTSSNNYVSPEQAGYQAPVQNKSRYVSPEQAGYQAPVHDKKRRNDRRRR